MYILGISTVDNDEAWVVIGIRTVQMRLLVDSTCYTRCSARELIASKPLDEVLTWMPTISLIPSW